VLQQINSAFVGYSNVLWEMQIRSLLEHCLKHIDDNMKRDMLDKGKPTVSLVMVSKGIFALQLLMYE
jgi:hypothetical protein